jgi:hypothetical protein
VPNWIDCVHGFLLARLDDIDGIGLAEYMYPYHKQVTIAPAYSGTITSITRVWAGLSGVVGPYMVGSLVAQVCFLRDGSRRHR